MLGGAGVIGGRGYKEKEKLLAIGVNNIQRKPGVVNRLTRPSEPLGSVSRANNLRFLGRSCLAVGLGLLDFHS